MSEEAYNLLMEELNFQDESVGISKVSFKDGETIKEILLEYGYEPVGYYETRNSEGYEFKSAVSGDSYSIQEVQEGLTIHRLIY